MIDEKFLIRKAEAVGYQKIEGDNIDNILKFLQDKGIQCTILPYRGPLGGYYFNDNGKKVYTYNIRIGNLGIAPETYVADFEETKREMIFIALAYVEELEIAKAV